MGVAESHCCPPETITALSTGFAATPKSLQSCPTLCDTMDHIAHQAPLSMGFSRQEYWSGLPRPPLGDIPGPGIKPASLMSPALAGRFYH